MIKGFIGKIYNTITNFIFIIKIFYGIYNTYFFYMVPQLLLKAVEPFILIVFPKLIIDELIIGKNFENIIIYLLYMLLFMVIIKISYSFLNTRTELHTNILKHKIDLYINSIMLNIKYSDLESEIVKNKLELAKDTGKSIEIIKIFTNLLSSVLTIFGVLIVISRMHFIIKVLIILSLIIKLTGENKAKKTWEKIRILMAPLERKGLYISNFGLDHSGAKEVRINNIREWLLDKWESINNNSTDLFMKHIKVSSKYNIFTHLSLFLQNTVTYIILVVGVINDVWTIGDFTMFLAAIDTLASSLDSTTSSLITLKKNNSYIKDYKEIYKLLKRNSKAHSKSMKIKNKERLLIEFKDVSFRYPNCSNYVLKNINISIKPNEKLSIVGFNGAGKTTFIKLLCRFYQPTEGRILINGIDINEIDYEDYIEYFSAVFQDYKNFSFSLKENIVLAQAENKYRIFEAMNKAGLMKKYKKLKEGLNTYIFKKFDENGIEFSGGEMQKLAIARALYKDAPIIILDEPTANLDPFIEYEIFKKFHSIAKEKTTIFVSHRLSSVQFSDRVAVFKGGEIVEYGSHKELLEMNGIYTDMFKKQANYYIS